ncbi:MAG TPA: sulfatase [Chitinophagaceae bacterium]
MAALKNRIMMRFIKKPLRGLFIQTGLLMLLLNFCSIVYAQQGDIRPEKINGVKPRNIIFILSDDHRFDFMGFTGKVPGLQTPNLDKLASEGAVFKNAFVTTSLCSPSRASILTGQYAHTHTVVDNEAPAPSSLTYFPQYLQKQGYQTAFLGKWHMGGNNDDPRPGFDHWVSFTGQGVYYNPLLNIDGKHVQYKDSSYVTDVLTDLAVDWLAKRDKNKPFFLYLSHKAVHADFFPSKKDKGKYNNIQIQYPMSMFATATSESKQFSKGKRASDNGYTINYKDIPQWVRNQRFSWHGVDYMYNGGTDFDQFYQDYLETLLGIDHSVGEVMDYLTKNGLDKETLIVYMSDNGFSFGEHGLIDKRHAYEESMRVPLIAHCPALIQSGTQVNGMVLNIDIAPSFLEMAGIKKPVQMQGNSFLPLLKGQQVPWRDKVFYEYYWENAFPQTPTQYAVRTDRYKYIRSQGVWDINQFYDLQKDPYEVNNLIRDPQYQELIQQLNGQLWDWLEQTNGTSIPLKRISNTKFDHKYKGTY